MRGTDTRLPSDVREAPIAQVAIQPVMGGGRGQLLVGHAQRRGEVHQEEIR